MTDYSSARATKSDGRSPINGSPPNRNASVCAGSPLSLDTLSQRIHKIDPARRVAALRHHAFEPHSRFTEQ
jgi:hypothetical protein